MKIIIDARLILSHQTGIGRYLLGLAQGFRDIRGSDEYEFWVQDNLPSSHPIWSVQSPSIKIQRVPVAHMSLRQQWHIPLKVKQTPHDIFHYPHFDLPVATPGKTVVTIYDLKYLVHPDFFPQFALTKRLIMQLMMAYSVRRAQRVITASKNSKDDIVQRLRIPPEKIRVTPLGVDEQYYVDHAPELITTYRRRINLLDPFILFVGERRPHKNIMGVIRAFQYFTSLTPKPYHLVIAGRSYAGYNEPEHMVDKLGLTDRVHFLEAPPEEEIRILLKSAEALLLLSRYEGFGLPLLEAMASGTPVIASDATSLPEVVDDAGIVVSADDPVAAGTALIQIINGGDKREMMIARGYERARLFSWERCARQTIDIYRELMDG